MLEEMCIRKTPTLYSMLGEGRGVGVRRTKQEIGGAQETKGKDKSKQFLILTSTL